MTTRTLPAQAQISTPSGWTVTATYYGNAHGQDVWQHLIQGPGYVYRRALMRPIERDPNPMAALESLGRALLDGRQLLPGDAAAELADAIAGMYGDPLAEPRHCKSCNADISEYAAGLTVCAICEPCPGPSARGGGK